MTPDEKRIVEAVEGEHRHCFTYCGDDRCTCPARPANTLVDFLAPALPVLETMLRTSGMGAGADKAKEMQAAVNDHRKDHHG